MVTPLQIDGMIRDVWGSFDPWAIAQLAPLVKSGCYKPKLYVGLDVAAQSVPARGHVSYGLTITPGSLIYGFQMGQLLNSLSPASQWAFQMTDTATGKQLWSAAVSQYFVCSNRGAGFNPVSGDGEELNYPCLLCAPYPVCGKGVFLVEVWNQISTAQTIVPLIGVFEVNEDPSGIAPDDWT